MTWSATEEQAELAVSHCWEMDVQIKLMDQNLSAAEENYSQKEEKHEEKYKDS